MILMVTWALCLFPLAVVADVEGNSILLLEINSGLIRGKIVVSHTQKEARVFYGIPYAEAPVGKLRFKPPVPVTPWTGVFDATKNPHPCYQQYTKESLRLSKKLGTPIRRPWSEDCLTLNVWTPADVPHQAPVFVFFSSEGFMSSSGSYPYVDISTFSVESDLMTVSINHRLGVFGFLSLGVPDLPGNVGLMDQQLALKWIRDNSNSFGGNTDAMILTGFRGGAASVGYQTLLRENEGLFKTAILFDGSPTCNWAWQTKEKAVEIARLLSQNLDCRDSNVTSEIECLQHAHPEDILDTSLLNEESKTDHFKPNVDGLFIKEQPVESMKAGRMNKVNVISVTSKKAESYTWFSLNEDLLIDPDAGLTEDGFLQAIKRGHLSQTDVEREVIRDWYLKQNPPMNFSEIRDAAVHMYTDGLSGCCSEEFLKYATIHGRLTFKMVYDILDDRIPSWIGAHSWIFFSIVTAEILNPKHGYKDDIKLSTLNAYKAGRIYYWKKAQELMKLVPVYNLEDESYGLRKTKVYHVTRQRRDACILWNEILPFMRKKRVTCNAK